MNSGKACKNLTDGLLLAAAFFALIFLAFGYLSFNGGYSMTHPATGEELEVVSAFDDPYFMAYGVLFLCFALTSVIGLATRKHPLVGLLASIVNLIVTFIYFSDGLIETWAILFVLAAVTGLAGSIVYICFYYYENIMESQFEKEKGED